MPYFGKSYLDAQIYDVASFGTDHMLSDNFVLSEVVSGCGADIVIQHPALIELRQKLRDHFGVLYISRSFSTPWHHLKISKQYGSDARGSYHPWGMADDIYSKNVSPVQIATKARELGAGGVSAYPESGFCHIDVGPKRTW